MKPIVFLITFIVASLSLSAQTNTFPSSGNAGIGTTIPAHPLHIKGDATSYLQPTPFIRCQDKTSGRFVDLFTDQHEVGLLMNNVHRVASREGVSMQIYSGNEPLEVVGWNTNLFAVKYANDGLTRFLVNTSGNVGIGTTTPSERLHVEGHILSNGNIKTTGSGSGFVMFNRATNASSSQWYSPTAGETRLYDQVANIDRLTINASGNVGIGTVSPGTYKLAVEGTVGARKVKVTQAPWADYVFDAGYRLRPLSEVAQYIQRYHHLPEVPSAAEVEKNGLDLGDNQSTLLKKIEELTLYLIEQNKKLEEQIRKNDDQQREIDALKKQVQKSKY